MAPKNIQDLNQDRFARISIPVDYIDYDRAKDPRILIPFSCYGHYGFMNRSGEVVIEPKFDVILDSCCKDSDVIRVGKYYTYGFNCKTKAPSTYLAAKYGLVDSKGRFILEPEYREIYVSDDNRLLTIRHMDYQYEVITIDGKVIVPKGVYPYVDCFSNGYVRVNCKDGAEKRWGLIDTEGKIVLPLRYSSIWNFCGHNRQWVTVEDMDEFGHKRVGKFYFSTCELKM